MKFFLSFYLFLIFISLEPVIANENSGSIEIDTITVAAPRLEDGLLDADNSIHNIDSFELLQKQPRSLPEALASVPGVMVQKTANGQGSPFIRGFTGYRTLALIDGVRYNNSVYRDGPNEYFSLIDSYTLDSIAVLNGPASAIYGSDAIGGTINLQTKQSHFVQQEAEQFFINAMQSFRYASAEHSFISRTEVDLGLGQDWGLLAGVSVKNFGDIDTADLGRLDKTGYDDRAFDLRFDWHLNEQWDITVAHQQLKQDDVWRTHSTIFSQSFSGTEVGSDLQRLKDQKRQLSYLKLTGYELTHWLDEAVLTLSRQHWREQADRIRQNGQRIEQYFDSTMYGFDLQLKSFIGDAILTYGLDYYQDNVDTGRIDYLANGEIDRIRIQGPVGDDAQFDLAGVYIQAKWDVTEKTAIKLSSRYSYVKADIGRFEDPFTNQPAQFQQRWDNLSSGIQASYDINGDGLNTLWAGVSQSFRAPNIADLSRFGKSRSNETEIAATSLSPEHFLTYELGLTVKRQQWQLSSTYYYTDIDDFVTSTPTGNIVAGGLVEVSKQNSAEGYIQGVELGLDINWSKNLSSNIEVTWLEGYLTRRDSLASNRVMTEPMSRIMPVTVHLGLEWRSDDRNKWLGTDVTLVAKADKLSAGDQSDTQRIPPGGTPSYQLLTLYGGWQVNPDLLLTLQIANLFDEAYRNHGSGSNEPGRNIVMGVNYQF